MSLLDVAGLQLAYVQSQVLFGLDLAVAEGEVATLLGRNGMGKSSTLRAVCGLSPAPAGILGGTIRFAGADIAGWTPDRVARAGIALVPEGRQIFPNLSVRENLVAFAANRRRVAEPWTLERVFALFPRLAERQQNMGNQLSGGEQQMLAIGRALMGRPKLLLLDEPSMGLAPIMVQKIFEVVRAVAAEGMTILLIEQNAKLALETSQRGYVMESGEITLTDEAAKLLHDPKVREAYLGE